MIISPDTQPSGTLSRDQSVVIHCLVSTTGALSARPLAGVMAHLPPARKQGAQWPGAREQGAQWPGVRKQGA